MKTKNIFRILLLCLCSSCFISCNKKNSRANGWYNVIPGQKDSIAHEPIVTVKDFTTLRLDSDAFGKYVITGQINKQPIGEWFKEQWEKLRRSLRQSAEEPRKSRGFKL